MLTPPPATNPCTVIVFVLISTRAKLLVPCSSPTPPEKNILSCNSAIVIQDVLIDPFIVKLKKI